MASGKRRRSSREPSTSQCQYVPAHPMRSDASETTVAIASLNTELRCPVCLRIMRDPVATECLHRFCKDCIERCQRLLKKECPSCRKPIATRRSMRPDPNFAGLIGALYPDLDELEAEEERTMAAENERLTRAHAEKITRDWQRQRSRQAVEPAAKIEYVYSGRGAMHTRSMGSESESESEGEEKEEEEEGEEEEGEEKEEEEEGEEEEEKEAAEEEEEEKAAAEEEEEEEEEEASPAAAEAEAASGGARDEAPPAAAKSRARRVQRLVERENEIAFRLTRHPLEVELPMLAKEKVAVDRVVKVETVQKFLSVKLKISDATKFQLRVRLQDFSHVLLLPEMSLGDVVQLYELDTKHLEFQFSYVHPPAALGGE